MNTALPSIPYRDPTLSREEKQSALLEVVELGQKLLSLKAFSAESLQKVVTWSSLETVSSTEVGSLEHLGDGKLPGSIPQRGGGAREHFANCPAARINGRLNQPGFTASPDGDIADSGGREQLLSDKQFQLQWIAECDNGPHLSTQLQAGKQSQLGLHTR